MKVFGLYMGEHKFPVTGTVELSRDGAHHVALDTPIEVYGAVRDRVILDHTQIQRVWSS